ncbi:MAG: hypothetical protein WCI20_00240 [bacterium]
MKKYTVLLLRPDYVADGFGTDTYLAQVEADSVSAAVLAAQAEVAKIDDLDLESIDYHPLITLEGWHDDLTPEVYR